jgi:sulfur-oxidizing protein SoxZ
MADAVVSVPATAKRGEIIEIKALVRHAMETGFRRTQLGELIPRDIIRQFVCTYNGEEVMRAEFHPAIAANPLFTFSTVATESGTIVLRWTGDRGLDVTGTAAITVT